MSTPPNEADRDLELRLSRKLLDVFIRAGLIFVLAAGHQKRKAGAARRVPHPRQLALALVGIVREAFLAVAIPPLLPFEVRAPVLGHRAIVTAWRASYARLSTSTV